MSQELLRRHLPSPLHAIAVIELDASSHIMPPSGRVSARFWPTTITARGAQLPPPRTYATQTSLGTTTPPTGSDRKRITVLSDTGRVPWGHLSPAEKVARTTQQTFNFTLIAGGAVATLAVFTLLYTDVFSADSKTAHFDRAVDAVRGDRRAVELLGGPGPDIRGYGESSLGNKWSRNRGIASRTETDKMGTQGLYIHFNVSGSKSDGVVQLHMLRRQDETHFHYGSLTLDVPGHERVWLENAEADKKHGKGQPGKFFGVRWT